MIDLKDAQYFLTLSQCLNITKAAHKLDINPSTLSRVINKLESATNTTLCLRDQKGVVLTKHGVQFATFAQNVLLEQNKLFRAFVKDEINISGNINICNQTLGVNKFLKYWFNDLQISYPNLNIKLVHSSSHLSLTQFDDLKTDLLITYKPQNIDADVQTINLSSTPLILIGPKKCFFKQGIDPQNNEFCSFDLNCAPFFIQEDGVIKEAIKEFCKKENIKLQNTIEQNSLNDIISLVSLGMGVSIVPKCALENSPYLNDVFVIQNQNIGNIEIILCTIKDYLQEKKIKMVFDNAKDNASSYIR